MLGEVMHRSDPCVVITGFPWRDPLFLARGFQSRVMENDVKPKVCAKRSPNADHNWSDEQLYRAYKCKHPQVETAKACIEFIRFADQMKYI
jgi:hypothetical protein